MADKVTIQDIADALGLSRNTVSKAINNTGILADTTREKILQKAIEMGYKQFSYTSLSQKVSLFTETNERCEIALLAADFLGNSHFSSTMLDKFQIEISQLGYSLTMHRILPEELQALMLPNSFSRKRTAGIICFELFDYRYSQMVCGLDIPVLFVDTPVIGLNPPLKADTLYMDNKSCIHTFIKEMMNRGKSKIGFIGEYLHCQSFFERYMAYRNAMYLLGLPCEDEYCIANRNVEIAPSGETYQNFIKESIKKMKKLPDVFICANDFIAMDVLQVFKELNICVPRDVYLCGFDDSPESKLISPSLTTIHIHSQIMGFAAVHLLISRIREPHLNYRTMYTETKLIYRESTEY